MSLETRVTMTSMQATQRITADEYLALDLEEQQPSSSTG
jgi:hypothetical protein